MNTTAATVGDWARVDTGTFHGFHQAFVGQICLALNTGLLPAGFYGQIQRSRGAASAPEVVADILISQPEPSVSADSESERYAARASRLAIKREIDHRVVAVLEVASPGNKDRTATTGRFLDKIEGALRADVHVVLIDLLPPGPADPRGLHAAVVDRVGTAFDPPAGSTRCAAGYRAGPVWRAYAQPLAVGDPLPSVPLFLTPDRYVDLPLGPPYAAARPVIGPWWVDVLEGRRDPV